MYSFFYCRRLFYIFSSNHSQYGRGEGVGAGDWVGQKFRCILPVPLTFSLIDPVKQNEVCPYSYNSVSNSSISRPTCCLCSELQDVVWPSILHPFSPHIHHRVEFCLNISLYKLKYQQISHKSMEVEHFLQKSSLLSWDRKWYTNSNEQFLIKVLAN